MYICETCGEDFEKDYRKDPYTKKKTKPRFCSRSCANKRIFTKEQNSKKGHKGELSGSWKGGISLVRVPCKACGKLIKPNKFGYCANCVRSTSEYRENLSKALLASENAGGVRKGSGRGKSGWYREYWCDSSWELAYVIYNIDHGVSFERNKEGFPYVFEGKTFKYFPDFIVSGNYVEVKGYMDEKNKAKISQFKKPLTVVNKEGIKPYISYVKETYGKDFIRLYE